MFRTMLAAVALLLAGPATQRRSSQADMPKYAGRRPAALAEIFRL
jgi:hypothetical protein